ncbi:hypothetical protein A2U01_0091139, partial [Trifolium medium]|nr:hypothetical protein [Trifolium medium]
MDMISIPSEATTKFSLVDNPSQ